jgi:hypothetical protein
MNNILVLFISYTMKKQLVILLSFISYLGIGQVNNLCDTIYSVPENAAKYPNDAKGLMNYGMEKLTPILSDCIKQDGEIIASLRMILTIDKAGKVIAVKFQNLNASAECKIKLRTELLAMEGWIPAQMNGINVCSDFYFPISCLTWR